MAAKRDTLSVELVDVASLIPDPENARKHSQRNVAAIAASLREFGQRRPLVVTNDGIVLAGNGTLEAAKSLGWTQISVTRTPAGWDYERARAYALADNRTGELAEWDATLLASQLLELDAVGWEVSEFGFEALKPPTDPEPPTDFPTYDDDTPTQHRCPKCGYEWSGSSK